MNYFRPVKYIKDESFDKFNSTSNIDFVINAKALPFAFSTLGVLILISQIIWPLISFKFYDVTPQSSSSSVLGYLTGFSDFEFTELKEEPAVLPSFDINLETNVPILAPSAAVNSTLSNVPEFFYLTIPKLGIKNAMIETNSKNLEPDNYLGHYPGTKLPGMVGNTFIYGHSVLPVFFNPNNYKTIFSTLDKLNPGDTFILTYNNKDYEYVVEESKVVEVADLKPRADLKPTFMNEDTVTLMTCWPFGTTLKRFVVNATLVN